MRKAVFLDRDGVLVEEIHLLRRSDDIRILPGVAEALAALAKAGYARIVVTNQPAVARGRATLEEVESIHRELEARLTSAGAPPMDGFYTCPHHVKGSVPEYCVDCECRKPRPGLIVTAAREHDIDLANSLIIGDRLSDVAAGIRAGFRGILVHSGAHREPLIESSDPVRPHERPHHTAADLPAAVRWILEGA
ncbi:MAG: HAD-IIIA family hydrolase [Chloroflexi bacterium]|nr:HAD-IIIA family hydrolase [Chloroflexota bacterium]